ncbi:MAG: protein-tyrosine phosphatase [Oleiphilaceae bacterium]|jgi:protein-tyrosine phosphatase
MINVLFVCLGNICRSPTAHGVFKKMVDDRQLNHRLTIDSAGTAAWHIGKAPDPRTQAMALNRHYDLSGLHARKVAMEDFEKFDYIFAMDHENLHNLQSICPTAYQSKLTLFLNFSERNEDEVPDPYYGGSDGFEHVLDLVESASLGFLEHLKLEHML